MVISYLRYLCLLAHRGVPSETPRAFPQVEKHQPQVKKPQVKKHQVFSLGERREEIRMRGVQHILCCSFCFVYLPLIMSCVLNVASFSGLFILDCPFGFLYRLFYTKYT